MTDNLAIQSATKGNLVIVDDDTVLADRLGKAMERRGFNVTVINSVKDAIEWFAENESDYALVDLRLADGSGLDITQKIKETVPNCRVVMMTAYGNIATAVAAVKAGAVDYLTKPTDADAVEAALLADGSQSALPPPPAKPMSAERVRWEHIQRIYQQCDRNISETARRLGMHRRTLQRILSKYAPKENVDS